MPETDFLQEWTVERVICNLPQLGEFNQSEALSKLSEHKAELCEALRGAMQKSAGLARLNAAVMLLKLDDRAGRDVFLNALSSADPALATAAINFLRGIAPCDTRFDEKRLHGPTTPISGAEYFAAIAHHLQDPLSELGDVSLFFCLKHDIEASRPIAKQFLGHPSEKVRLLTAEWRLRHGHDEGALAVLQAFFEAASAASDPQTPNWRRPKDLWFAVRDCCKTAPEPLRTNAAKMAMRIVVATLDAPDWKRRTHVNDGYVAISEAAHAIACVMPDGAEAVLERIISGSFDDFNTGDDYSRGETIIALARGSGARSLSRVRGLLSDAAVRKYAASALGELSRNSNSQNDIAALVNALDGETRSEVIGAVLNALAEVGPDAERHVKAALDSAPPWTRMELTWRMQGLSARAIADMLAEAGAMDPLDDNALAEATQQGERMDPMGLLWAGGKRLAVMNMKSDDMPPPHHALFKALIDIARPRLEVEKLAQSHDDNYRREPVPDSPKVTAITDLGVTCEVSFVYRGVAHSFTARPTGRWFDLAAVMEGFNMFMAVIGREDRCFQLEMGDSYGIFLVAHEASFAKSWSVFSSLWSLTPTRPAGMASLTRSGRSPRCEPGAWRWPVGGASNGAGASRQYSGIAGNNGEFNPRRGRVKLLIGEMRTEAPKKYSKIGRFLHDIAALR